MHIVERQFHGSLFKSPIEELNDYIDDRHLKRDDVISVEIHRNPDDEFITFIHFIDG